MLYIYGWVIIYIIVFALLCIGLKIRIDRLRKPKNSQDFELALLYLVIDFYAFYIVINSFSNFIYPLRGSI